MVGSRLQGRDGWSGSGTRPPTHEISLDDWRSDWVDSEPVKTLTVGSLPWIGVSTRVRQDVSIRRPTTEESALMFGLGGHRCTDTNLDPISLALAHAPKEAHHEIMSVGAWVDFSADFRYP